MTRRAFKLCRVIRGAEGASSTPNQQKTFRGATRKMVQRGSNNFVMMKALRLQSFVANGADAAENEPKH